MPAPENASTPATRLGAWLINIGKHLSMVAPNDLALSEVDNLLFAGKCGALLVKLSSDTTGKVTGGQLKAFARVCAIGPHELSAYLEELKRLRCVDTAATTGDVEALALSRKRVLESAAKVFSARNPEAVESAIPKLLEFCLLRPRLLSEADAFLCLTASNKEAQRVVELARHFRLLDAVAPDTARHETGDTVLYNGYQFGDKAGRLVRTLNSLSPTDRQQLDDLLGAVRQQAGVLLDSIPSDPRIVKLAIGLGMIELSEVTSPIGSAKFLTMPAFSAPSVGSESAQLEDDVFHHAKLLLTSFRFGQLKSTSGRGRIDSPIVLVDRLLTRGQVGPCTAIGEDYRLLELEGLVKAVPSVTKPGQFYLQLRRREPAEVVLTLLESGAADSVAAPRSPKGLDLPTQFTMPEKHRAAAFAWSTHQDPAALRRIVQEIRT